MLQGRVFKLVLFLEGVVLHGKVLAEVDPGRRKECCVGSHQHRFVPIEAQRNRHVGGYI